MVTAKLDTGYRSKGLFGIWKYDFTERSADVPGELFQLDSWVYQPESEQQEAYLTGKAFTAISCMKIIWTLVRS